MLLPVAVPRRCQSTRDWTPTMKDVVLRPIPQPVTKLDRAACTGDDDAVSCRNSKPEIPATVSPSIAVLRNPMRRYNRAESDDARGHPTDIDASVKPATTGGWRM